MTSLPVPGRGAWRLTGGLLPAKPATTSTVGYYRLAVSPEAPIGSLWLRQRDTTHHAHVVMLGVVALQKLVGLTGTDADGWYGPITDRAVRAAQQRWAVEVDGIVGPGTMRAGLNGVVTAVAQAQQVPVDVLGGILVHESNLDPAAVGLNGYDHGLAQINLAAHLTISLEQALDPDFAIRWTAKDLWTTYQAWVGKTTADPWDIAVAHHNSPALARKWATTGSPPYVEGRLFQIDTYVAAVRQAW